MCSALMMPASIFLYRICFKREKGSDKKKILQLSKNPQKSPSTVQRKSAADPQNFKPFFLICVDFPCCQTYIWFVFLVMVIDHPTGLDLINTEAVHRSGTYTHINILYTVCLCRRHLYHFQLWPQERTGGPLKLWWICQTQRLCVFVCVYVHICMVTWQCYIL